MKKDLVIGIVGTVILLAAMIGVFQYEAARGGGQSWLVTWEETTTAGPTAEGSTREGGTTPQEVAIGALNVTRIAFVLAWTDDVGAADTFNLTIGGPDGRNWSAEGRSGEVTVVVEGLAAIPGQVRLLASSEDEAAARVARDTASDAAVGVWTAFVRLVDAPGLMAPAGNVEVQPDGQNAWTLRTSLTTYAPRFEQG